MYLNKIPSEKDPNLGRHTIPTWFYSSLILSTHTKTLDQTTDFSWEVGGPRDQSNSPRGSTDLFLLVNTPTLFTNCANDKLLELSTPSSLELFTLSSPSSPL